MRGASRLIPLPSFLALLPAGAHFYEGPSPLPEAAVQRAQLADRAGATCVERIGGSGDNRRAHG